MEKVGSYYIIRVGWRCNLCGHMTFSGNITHKCHHAPHFQAEEVVCCVPKRKIKKVLEYIEFLRN